MHDVTWGTNHLNEKGFRITYAAWLFSSIVILSWFDYVAITALARFSRDPAGNIIFQATSPDGQVKTIYPATYAVAAVSVIGVTYYIYKAERRWWSVPLGLVAARAATIGMVNLYEQVFIGLGDFVWTRGLWWQYYGKDLPTVMWTMLAVVWNVTTIPWWQKKNFKLAIVFFASYLMVMLAWLSIGYPSVESGSLLAYLLNTISRLLSQVTHVVLVRR